jgi:hypothetical protein
MRYHAGRLVAWGNAGSGIDFPVLIGWVKLSFIFKIILLWT